MVLATHQDLNVFGMLYPALGKPFHTTDLKKYLQSLNQILGVLTFVFCPYIMMNIKILNQYEKEIHNASVGDKT